MSREQQEKRRFERFSSESAVWARPLGETREHDLLEVVNISAGGMLIELDHALAPETMLELCFELPQHGDLIEANGRVVRCSRLAEGRFHIGIAFTRVLNLPTATLMTYLEAIYT